MGKKKNRKSNRKKQKNSGNEQGAQFISDFVYEGKSAIDEVTNYGTRFGENPKLEIEYGDQFLVYTVSSAAETRRELYIGDFDISKDGIIRRATVSEERHESSRSEGILGPKTHQYAPFTLENVDGLVEFWAASVTATTASGYEYTYGDREESLNQRFFPSNWWNDPFAPNLI